MSALAYVIIALVGLAIGSFSCVIIDRLPVALDEPNRFGELWDTRPWGEVLGGRSRCSSCGVDVRARDNIPVIGWLVLRGKCRECGESIPGFHPLVEVLVPVVAVLVALGLGETWLLLPALFLVPLGVAIAVIDMRTLMVPTRLIWPSLGIALVLFVITAWQMNEWGRMLSIVMGVLVFAGPLFAIWFIHPRGMGFGDVRLAVLLGAYLGFFAGPSLSSAAILAALCMLLSALFGLAFGLVGMGLRGMKTQIPFGPGLVSATLFCIALHDPILDAFGR